MVRVFLFLFVLVVASVVSLAGFRGQKFTGTPLQITPDMKHQPKVITQHGSAFFADNRGDHPLIPGTIPAGYNLPGRYLQTGVNNVNTSSTFTSEPTYVETGVMGEFYGDGIPLEVNEKFLQRGRERYEIFCAVCHDRSGSGNGITKAYGLATVASLIDDRIKSQPDGQIYATITNGKNTMGAYGPSIATEDRWAIVSYVRALQKGQSVKVELLSPEVKAQLEKK
ncbi:MAG: subunit III [Verrucomicrobia bacterium]|nr:MAG: subunit III [Verrucomicrobiota bacterium]